MKSYPHESRRGGTPEFWLVVIMLFTLTVLVVVVLRLDVHVSSVADTPKASEILDYRKSILTVIITAFGAWVGAGAAYFFGRENMREAARSLLQMHQTPADWLEKTQIRNLPRRTIQWTVQATDTVETVYKQINRKERWFVPIVKADGGLDNVIHEDAILRFIDSQSAAGTAYQDIMKKPLAEVVAYIQSKPEFKDLDAIYVEAGLDDSAGEIHAQMRRKDVYLGIMNDANGRPTHYITTEDIRMMLLQSP